VIVELFEAPSRDPVFRVASTSGRLLLELTQVSIIDLELHDEPSSRLLDIPLPGYLLRIVPLNYRIEDGLLRKSRRKPLPARLCDKPQLLRPYRTV
jgi:hypothetical protein